MATRVLICALLLLGSQQYAAAAVTAQWKLQDNAASTTVVATVGTDGTLTGAGNTSASSSTSGPGTALTRYLLFDGVNDSVNVTTGNATAAKNKAVLTLCCWMYVASADTTGTHRMVYVSTNASAGSTRASIGVNTSGQIVASARAGDGESAQTKTSSSSYDDSTWRHVAVVFDYAADTITIYVDGSSVSSTGTISFTATASGNTDSLGVYLASTNSSDYFKGRLADCRIYDSNESANLSAIIAEKDSGASARDPLSATIPSVSRDPLTGTIPGL